MKELKYTLFGLACGVLASGLVLLISTPPRDVLFSLPHPAHPFPAYG